MDPLVEKTGTSYLYCYQNPVKLIDPNGKETEDIVITGSNESSLTIKTDLVDLKINSEIDFGGHNTILDVSNVAIGYERGISGNAQMFAGVKGEVGIQSVLFLGGEYSGYWYDYLTYGSGFALQTGVAASVDANQNFFIAFCADPEYNTPTAFQGSFVRAGMEIGVELGIVGASTSLNYATSLDENWSTISINLSSGYGPQMGIFEGGYFGGDLILGTAQLLHPNNVIPTKSRSTLDKIKNWTIYRILPLE